MPVAAASRSRLPVTEIARYLKARPEDAEDVMLELRYFEEMNFAEMISCNTLSGLGLRDPVVPAETVYSIANYLSAPCEIMEFAVSHTGLARRKTIGAMRGSLARHRARRGRTASVRNADTGLTARRRFPPSHDAAAGRIVVLRFERGLAAPASEDLVPCVTRWNQTLGAAIALRVDLEAAHSYVLEFVSLEGLQAHALSSH